MLGFDVAMDGEWGVVGEGRSGNRRLKPTVNRSDASARRLWYALVESAEAAETGVCSRFFASLRMTTVSR